MESLLRWDPYQEAVPQRQTQLFIPAFEVRETKEGYLFKGDLPGVKEADLDISLTGYQLIISGKREDESQQEGGTYYAYERAYGSFTRTFTLPQSADVEHVRAELKDGVLTLLVPKKPEMQPRKIGLSGANKTNA
jgi:HSP20 family protein